MDHILSYVNNITENVFKIILSNPNKKNYEFKKVIINKIENKYQIEKHTMSQVFHTNMNFNEMIEFISGHISENYKQLNAWDEQFEYSLRVSNKNKIFFNKVQNISAPKKKDQHNDKKKYILNEGLIIPPLIDMGIFSKEGKIVNQKYDKYKQINRFLEIIEDEVSNYKVKEKINIIDFGCGKSYLTFILYYYFTEIKKLDVKITGLDLKKAVIEKCNELSIKYGYKNLKFELGDINGYKCTEKINMVITLHACDTATDYALFNAIKWNSDLIFSVPCCQHELNNQIDSSNFSILTRYGIVKERFSALATDVIRSNLLGYCGYKSQLLEFIDFDHTPKNILIRAKKTNIIAAKKIELLEEVKNLNKEFSLNPKLYNLLISEKIINDNIK